MASLRTIKRRRQRKTPKPRSEPLTVGERAMLSDALRVFANNARLLFMLEREGPILVRGAKVGFTVNIRQPTRLVQLAKRPGLEPGLTG